MTARERALRALGLMAGGIGDPRDAENLREVTRAIEDAVAAERIRLAALAEQAAIQTLGDPRAIYERVRKG